MRNKPQIFLPKQLIKYNDIIQKTVVPYIRINGEMRKTGVYESKFGGTPYFPKDMEYPIDYNSKPMK